MTPQEKAKELIDKFYNYSSSLDEAMTHTQTQRWWSAKQCALIAVEEIIKPMNYPKKYSFPSHITRHLSPPLERYWQEVKQEIEKT